MQIRTFMHSRPSLAEAIEETEKEANQFLSTLKKDQIVFVHPQSLLAT